MLFFVRANGGPDESEMGMEEKLGYKASDFTEILNEVAADGWELVAVVMPGLLFFKRPKIAETAAQQFGKTESKAQPYLGSLRGKDPSFVHAFLARHECYVDALGERDVTPGFSGLATRVEDQPFVPVDVFPAHAEDLAWTKTGIQHDQQHRSKRLPAHTRLPAFPGKTRAPGNRQQPLLHPRPDHLFPPRFLDEFDNRNGREQLPLLRLFQHAPKRAQSVVGVRGGRSLDRQSVIRRDVIELHTSDGCGLQELPAHPVIPAGWRFWRTVRRQRLQPFKKAVREAGQRSHVSAPRQTTVFQ